MRKIRNYLLYGSLCGLVFLASYRSYQIGSVKNNVKELITTAKVSIEKNQIESTTGFLKFSRGYYTLVLHTDPKSNDYHSEFLIVTRTNDNIYVELICGPGPENVIIFRDNEAFIVLEQFEVDISALDNIWFMKQEQFLD